MSTEIVVGCPTQEEKKTVKLVCMSDLHGHLPEVPEADILILSGDLCPVIDHRPIFQAAWLDGPFRRWLELAPVAFVIATVGNHDKIFAQAPQLLPSMLPWTLLIDRGVRCLGLNIWGAPWQKPFGHGWAFNLPEDQMARKWAMIPDDTDVLILHGPPYGYGDAVGSELTGSQSLTDRIREIQPKLVTFGHIHPAYGVYKLGNSMLANVALLNDAYELVNQPFIFEIEVEDKLCTTNLTNPSSKSIITTESSELP